MLWFDRLPDRLCYLTLIGCFIASMVFRCLNPADVTTDSIVGAVFLFVLSLILLSSALDRVRSLTLALFVLCPAFFAITTFLSANASLKRELDALELGMLVATIASYCFGKSADVLEWASSLFRRR
jgi:hypothetical protein